MTAQPTRDQLRALADTVLDGGRYLADEEEIAIAQGVRHLLDQLDQAEARLARLEAQTDIRGRAVVIYRERARGAEAQIKAVRELHCSDGHDGTCGGSDCFESCVGCLEDYPCSTIRALDN